MNYDAALAQANCVLDDEFNNDFQVFDESIAGEDFVTFCLQNWFNSSGEKKVEFADNLDFAIRTIRTARTNKKMADLTDEILTESGGKVDTETGDWI